MDAWIVRWAGALFLCFACSCADVGVCDPSLEGRDTVVVNNTILYGGQAIMNKACSVGCHLSTATGADRHGAPAGLDFDLLPIDEANAAGMTKSGDSTIVRLTSAQLDGLRKRQRMIVELRDDIWQQVVDGQMPPGGMLGSVMGTIFASSERRPCRAGTSYAEMDGAQTREIMRNWLACGAPFVETNGKKLDQSSAAGMAGDQYLACVQESDAGVTLERLFKSTFSECGGCHNSSITGPPSFLDVATLAKSLRTKSACGGKPFVTPGDPEKSYLLELLRGPNPACNHDRMPAGGLDPLSDRAIAEVATWIANGAPTTAADLSAPDDRTKGDRGTDDESSSENE